ncbi:DUF2244 domain-containing protein [Marinobacter sp. CHS3-4]|uniref:DUF2244 domain-containing protein n=1 Tax=Marinobacter sp. CHS3-4 TaxID=3045174 RepID=UPI0024B60477|nr:DUF2244 domain-containing protein [Marinobacter sp. CHS3-4]MDI9244823.1 DUF2244 domain-containing protein [Marinobacter sp. CHS3-4]
MVEQLPSDDGHRYLLTPNRSMSWAGNVRIWLALLGLTTVIVAGFTLIGAWVILPFAGLELAALAAGFYYTARQCQRQEVLLLGPDTIRLEKGMKRKEAEWEIPRQFSRVWQDEPRHPFTPPKLHLQFRNEEIPIGSFLNMDDTETLIAILQRYGILIQKRKKPEPRWF